MSSPTTARVPALRRGHPALRRLVGVEPEAFADRYWGREPLLTRAGDLPTGFADLFGADAVDELVSTRGLRAPFLRVAQDGVTLGDRAFTSGGGVGAAITDQVSDDKVLRLFAEGATLVLQGLHRTWSALVDFSQALAADLGHPVQVNAYVTPPQSTGFADHYDVHDVFVLQVEGTKTWRVRPPVHPLPLRDEPWTDRRAAVVDAAESAPLIEATLRPGDCLYLPRGYLHSASALGEVSTHLTIGVHAWTRRHLADELVALAVRRVGQDPALRESLPLGVDLGDPDAVDGDVELVRAALLRAVAEAEAHVLVAALGDRSRSAQRAAPVRPLATAVAAARLEPGRLLAVRPYLEEAWVSSGDGPAVLRSRAGELRLEAAEAAAVRVFIETGSATAGAVGLPLARRLLLAGVAVLA